MTNGSGSQPSDAGVPTNAPNSTPNSAPTDGGVQAIFPSVGVKQPNSSPIVPQTSTQIQPNATGTPASISNDNSGADSNGNAGLKSLQQRLSAMRKSSSGGGSPTAAVVRGPVVENGIAMPAVSTPAAPMTAGPRRPPRLLWRNASTRLARSTARKHRSCRNSIHHPRR